MSEENGLLNTKTFYTRTFVQENLAWFLWELWWDLKNLISYMGNILCGKHS